MMNSIRHHPRVSPPSLAKMISLRHRAALSTTGLNLKIIPEAMQTTPGKRPAEMDKVLDTTKTNQEQLDGYGAGNAAQADAPGSSSAKPAFSKDGSIGSKFRADGAVGAAVDKNVGGPFSKGGVVGKAFEPEGAVGARVEEKLGGGKE